MKFRYLIGTLLLGLGIVSACTEEELQTLSELQVSESYVSLEVGGSTSSITVTATENWSVVAESVPEWLTVSPMSGAAGETTLSFTAGATTATRNAEVKLLCNARNQFINVIQYAEKVEPKMSTVAEVLAGADGDVFRVKGVCSRYDTENANAVLYGNWYITDDTGTVYIYGTLNKAGQTKGNPLTDWGIEVGDVVTIEGPRSTYGTTVELVDVTVLGIEKSLIQIGELGFETLPAEGQTFEMKVNAKESPLLVTTDADWLKVTGVKEGNVYVLTAEANDYTAIRSAVITVKGPTAIATKEVKQDGIPATGKSVTDIIAEADNAQVETLESTVVALTTKGAVISDGSKAIYVYGNAAAAAAIGDNVKVFGKKTTYNGVPEITDITEVSIISSGNAVSYPVAKDVTPEVETYSAAEAEFVKITGTLSKSGNYYNLVLDGTTAKQGSLSNPVASLNADSFDTKKVTVTGYFNGLSGTGGKYVNVIVTKIEEAGADNGSTISEILALENGTACESKTALVTAITSRGFVATDGTKSIYVYTQGTSFNGVAKIGDKVKFAGTKTEYSNMPEITPVTALDVVSSGNEVVYPTAKDITAEAETYTATEAEFISLTGTLAKSGNYYNLVLDGTTAKQGSIVYPADYLDAASYDTKKITITGYFNGLTGSGKYINIITTKIEEAAAAGSSFAIDGNFDDWADVTAFASAANSRIREWKFYADSEKVYFYIALRKNRADSSRKLVIGFNTDKDNNTGNLTDNNEMKGCEAIARNLVPFTDSNTAAFTGTATGEVVSTAGETVSDVVVVWAVPGTEDASSDSSNAYLELSIPKAKLGLPTGTAINIGLSYDYYFTGYQSITL